MSPVGPRRPAGRWLLPALALSLLLPGCGSPETAETRRDVLLVSIDTLRATDLGAYGSPRPVSPWLDELASRSIQFRDCIVQAPWTLPSHVSLLTSLRPGTHRVTLQTSRMPAALRTAPEHLRYLGWRTRGIYSNPFLSHLFGFEQGFDGYTDAGHGPGEAGTEQALRWLEGLAPEDRFFLFLHYNDPHVPYRAPGPFETLHDPAYGGDLDGSVETVRRFVDLPLPSEDLSYLHSLYLGEVRYVDRQIEAVLERLRELGRYEECLVVVTSDHGEEFQEHGRLEHHQTLYDELLRVPLLVKLPASLGIPPGLISRPVRTIDILPTLLEVLEAPPPPEPLEGSSLLGLMRSPDGTPEEPIRSEAGDLSAVALRSSRWKYIYSRRGDRRELYDLRADPGERENLVDREPEVAARLQERAESHVLGARGGWQVRVWHPGVLEATLVTDGRIVAVSPMAAEEPRDWIRLSEDRRELALRLAASDAVDPCDGVDLRLEPAEASLQLWLANPEEGLASLRIGRDGRPPRAHPVVLAGPGREVNPRVGLTDELPLVVAQEGPAGGVSVCRLVPAERERVELDAAAREDLRSLGYLSP